LMETTLQKTYLVIFSHIAILYFGFFTSQRWRTRARLTL
jgi:hypothetical protein